MTVDASPSTRAEFTSAARRYGPWAAVAAVMLAHLAIAAQSVGPMYLFDEVGYLAAAEVLGATQADWALCGSSYAVGYSAVLAPLWWLPIDPVTLYKVAASLTAVLGAAVMWPAAVFGRLLGAPRWLAWGAGALVTLVPARALLDNYVLAENALTFLVAWAAVAGLTLARRGGLVTHLWLGLLLGAAAAVHGRALPFALVGAAWLLVRAWRRASPWRDALVGAVTAGALAAAGFFAQRAMGAATFSDDSRVEDLLGSVTPGGLGSVAVGQLFTQVVSWSLLTVLGGIVIATHARTSWSRRGLDGLASPWVWQLAAVGAQAVFFVAVLAASDQIGIRLDIPVFGRYLDPFVVPVAVVGAVTLWSRTRPRAVRAAAGAALVAIAAYTAILLPQVDPEARWIPFAVPGLEPFLDPVTGDDRPSLAVAAVTAAAGVVLLYVFRARARLSLAVALIVATAITGTTDWFRVDPFEAEVRVRTTILAFLQANPEQPVALAAEALPCAERNKLQFELAGWARLVPAGGNLGDGYVVGPAEWPDAEGLGLIRVPLTVWGAAAVWAPETGF